MSSTCSSITPDDVMQLQVPTEHFLCPLNANTYDIEFINFVISDYETKKVLFEVGKDCPPPPDMHIDMTNYEEDSFRRIRYEFSEDVLRLPIIQTTLQFSGGDKEVRDFRMIERHYFKSRLVKSFDFPFGFCIPRSTNCWEATYELPALSDELIADMIGNPYETQSDSFYFVNNKLIMHNKASYKYIREDSAQSKKSYEDKYGFKGAKRSKGSSKDSKAFDDEQHLEDDIKAEEKFTVRRTVAKIGAKEDTPWSKDTDYL